MKANSRIGTGPGRRAGLGFSSRVRVRVYLSQTGSKVGYQIWFL